MLHDRRVSLSKRIRNIVLILGILFVSIGGLMAASTRIPNVGCDSGRFGGGLHESKTNIVLSVPVEAVSGEAFTINGILEAGYFLEPFAQQRLTISTKSFQKEIITDDQGKFSCDIVIDEQGSYTVTASYPGDRAGFFWSSFSTRKVKVTGETKTTPPTAFPISKLAYCLVAGIAIILLSWQFLFRRLLQRRWEENSIPKFLRWFSASLILVTVGAVLFAFVFGGQTQKSIPAEDDFHISSYSPDGSLTGISLEMPAEGIAREPLSFKGSLWRWEDSFRTKSPLANKRIVLQKVDYKTGFYYNWSHFAVSDDQGNFAGEIEFLKPGEYLVAARDAFSINPDSGWAMERIIIARALPFSHWNGEGWMIIYGLLIMLLILGYRLVYLRRVKARNLAVSFLFNALPGALLIVEVFAVFSNASTEGLIRIDVIDDPRTVFTEISLEIPQKIQPGQTFDITGRLNVENDRSSPIPEQSIDIWLTDIRDKSGAATKLTTLVTDESGYFTSQVTIDSPGQYDIEAVYDEESTTYFKSGITKSLVVENPAIISPGDETNDNPNKLLIVIGILVFILLTTGSFLLGRYGFRHRHFNKKTAPTKPNAAVIPSLIVPISPQAPAPPVTIAFPQIPPEMPEVWGRDESLLIVFRVGGAPQILVDYSLDIELGTGNPVRTRIGGDGRASQTQVFHRTGEYHIQAVLVKEVRNGYLPASRMVRIVDYREEIVRLYNELLGLLKNRGLVLNPKMTVREVETRLTRAFPSLPNSVTATLVSIFEEANYSLHPITRGSYVEMYRAILEIKKNVNEIRPEK
jgi:hypothetical protein